MSYQRSDLIRRLGPVGAAALQELQKRERLAKRADELGSGLLRDPNFLFQNSYLDGRYKHRKRAFNCSRRTGKSIGDAIDDCEIMSLYPGRILKMGLTADSIVDIAWESFEELDELHEIGLKFVKSRYRIFHPNRSSVRFFGADASNKEMKKALGQKLRKVGIDEAGSFTVDMVKLVDQTVFPALMDLKPLSWLSLLGTCENIPGTYFQKVTEGEWGNDWGVYRATAEVNPHMCEQYLSEIEDIVKANPKAKEASWFKTHYLNQWCTDDDLLIIPTEGALFEKFNEANYPDVRYGLGVDMGYNDACSFTVTAWSRATNRLHFVKSYKQSGMDITDLANEIHKIRRQYKVTEIEIDGANKQGVEEMKKRHNLPMLESAEKMGKPTFLRLLRDDVKTHTVAIDPEECSDLVTEWDHLIWRNEQKDTEHPTCENHCSDSALYIWRKARNYFYKEPAPPENPHTEEFYQKKKQEHMDKLRRMKQMSDRESSMLY